jgi:hypothetical protein
VLVTGQQGVDQRRLVGVDVEINGQSCHYDGAPGAMVTECAAAQALA